MDAILAERKVEMKQEYFELIRKTFEDCSTECEMDNVAEIIDDLYDTVMNCYHQAKRKCFFTKSMFVKTFCRVYEDLGNVVFEINPPTFAKCVSKMYEGEDIHFTEYDIEEMNQNVWEVFS